MSNAPESPVDEANRKIRQHRQEAELALNLGDAALQSCENRAKRSKERCLERVAGGGKIVTKDKRILHNPKTGAWFYKTDIGTTVYLKRREWETYTAYGRSDFGPKDQINRWGLVGVTLDSMF